jgi:uncharacterized alpha-E superfamily protein
MVVSLQRGGGSKDTWVLSDGPVAETTLLAPTAQPIALNRGGGYLPSRIADDLFWLGRYVQRAEAAARTGRTAVSRLIDVSGVEALPAVRALVRTLRGDKPAGPLDHDLIEAIFLKLRPATASIHRLARMLRDRISVDAWRILQAINRDVSGFQVDPADPCSGVPDLLDGLIPAFAACVGLSTDSMTRGQAWRFLDLGHRIERAMATAQLLRDTLVEVPEDEASLIEALLEISDSSLTYRRRYLTRLEVHALVDLLVADEANPRSVAYQAEEILRHLEALPHDWMHPREGQDRQRAAKLRSSLQAADIEAACETNLGRRVALDALLGGTLDELALLADAIARIYFTHATVPRGLLVPGQQEPTT